MGLGWSFGEKNFLCKLYIRGFLRLQRTKRKFFFFFFRLCFMEEKKDANGHSSDLRRSCFFLLLKKGNEELMLFLDICMFSSGVMCSSWPGLGSAHDVSS